MMNLVQLVKKFHNDEEGGIVETGIIIGILAVISLGALVYLNPKIKQMFTKGGDALDQGNSVNY